MVSAEDRGMSILSQHHSRCNLLSPPRTNTEFGESKCHEVIGAANFPSFSTWDLHAHLFWPKISTTFFSDLETLENFVATGLSLSRKTTYQQKF